MFPRLREQLGTALDLIVEFSTLGEYRLGAVHAPGAATAPADAPGHAPQLGGAGHPAGRAAGRHTVAGGATGRAPVATPAARRLLAALETPAPSQVAAAPAGRLPRSALGSAARVADPCRGDRRRLPRDSVARSGPSSTSASGGERRASSAASPEQLCFAV
jgi:hypothetical protein